MTVLRMRRGSGDDNDWLFELFRRTMREYIEQAWGWDEMFQREAFLTHLPGKSFQILELDKRPVGGYQIKNKEQHLWLEMILVDPEYQRQGHGSFMLELIRQRAEEAGLPVKLACLRCNPACRFYLRRGFSTYDEDPNSLMMAWQPESNPAASTP